MTPDAPNGRCEKCGGPLLSGDGQEAHAVCSRTEHGDPDMNPEAQRRRRETVRYIREQYGSVDNAPDWIVRGLRA